MFSLHKTGLEIFECGQNIAMFNKKKLKLETMIVPGGHTWMNCKLFLANSLTQIFKE